MPATVTSRPMPALSSKLAGITIRPCLSSSASIPEAKKNRCIVRASRLSGSSVPTRSASFAHSAAA